MLHVEVGEAVTGCEERRHRRGIVSDSELQLVRIGDGTEKLTRYGKPALTGFAERAQFEFSDVSGGCQDTVAFSRNRVCPTPKLDDAPCSCPPKSSMCIVELGLAKSGTPAGSL